jgi:pimeloyl-ACP methyl ester carboxylesterase
MKLSPENSAFVHGLWFDTVGQLASEISKTSTIIPVLGLDTMEDRIQCVLDFLGNNSRVKTLIGHSAGALVLAHMIERDILPRSVIRVVLLNPALFPGIKFGLRDLVTIASAKYLPELIVKSLRNARFRMEDKDNLRLLGIDNHQLRDVIPDSAKFILSIVKAQMSRKWKVPFFASRSLTLVTTSNDQMVGPRSYQKLEPYFFYEKTVRVLGGHMETIYGYRQTLEMIGL